MDLTTSFKQTLSDGLLDKYQFLEVRNAAAVLSASDKRRLYEIDLILRDFNVYDDDILVPGGNRGRIAIRIDSMFANFGWKPVRVNTEYRLVGHVKASSRGRLGEEFLNTTVSNEGFEVDNMKGRIALDVEWNAKDGNLDRDLSAYRSLYDLGLIDCAVIITRDHAGISQLAWDDLDSADAYRRLGTSTSTCMEKLAPRLTRGDAGGCPVLAIGISRTTWAGPGVVAPKLVVPPTVDIDEA